ncbi:MAG: hypothetical protein RJA04_296 [Bacteroidota bacterium]|jgi:hypothetical protein
MITMKQPFNHPFLLVFITPLAQLASVIIIYVPGLFPVFMVPLGTNQQHHKFENYLYFCTVILIFNLAYFAFLGLGCLVYSKNGRLIGFLLIWFLSSGIGTFFLPYPVDLFAFVGNLLYNLGFYWWYRKFEIEPVRQNANFKTLERK